MAQLKNEIRKELKEEISEEVKEIIYEKAKKEVKNKIKQKYYSIKDWILRVLGFGETQEQKIRRISTELKSNVDPMLSDGALGTMELFSINYVYCLLDLVGFDISEIQNNHETNDK